MGIFRNKAEKRFNWNLAQRFVNDYKLPIPIMGSKIFVYHLNLYEKEFGTLSKWERLWELIDKRFKGNPEAFLNEFYAARERIVTEIPSTEAFEKFNNMDMSAFPVENLKPKHKNVYNEESIGKVFVSIDLSKANFQALNYVDKNILGNCETYDQFIMKYSDLYYIRESKYFRQVIFGKMNPSRHTTVEKHMMCMVHNLIKEEFPNLTTLDVFCSDELVYEVGDTVHAPDLALLTKKVREKLGIKVHAELFTLEGWNLYSGKDGDEHKRCSFYRKHDELKQEYGELMCVPMPYHSIVYKLMHGMKVRKKDRHFNYENIDCIFNDKFTIKPIV